MNEMSDELEIDDLFRRAFATHRLRVERALGRRRVTAAQYAVLRRMLRQDGASSADLAREEKLTPQTLTVVIRNLSRKRALTRVADQSNARIRRLYLTAAGRALASDCAAQVRPIARRLAAAMPDGGEPVIRAWLQRLLDPQL
jgi:DNA-binding MarR family transcriptional regulator